MQGENKVGIRIAVGTALTLLLELTPASGGETGSVEAAVRDLAAPDPALRRAAAARIGVYPQGARGIPALVEARRDEDATVRAAVDDALRRFAERSFVDAAARVSRIEPTESPADVTLLQLFVEEHLFLTGEGVAKALTEGAENTIAPLVTLAARQYAVRDQYALYSWLLDHPSPDARQNATIAIGLASEVAPSGEVVPSDVAQALARLVAFLRAIPAQSRASAPEATSWPRASAWLAAKLLARAPALDDETARYLADRASDRTAHGSHWSALALERLAAHSARARAALATMPWDDDPSTLAIRARTLAETGLVDIVRAKLAAPDPIVRAAAARGLAEAGQATPAAIALLIEGVQGTSPQSRMDPVKSARALGYAGAAAIAAAPALEARWRTLPSGRTEEAWAHWRVDPTAVAARSRVRATLLSKRPLDVSETAELLADSGPAVVELLPEILEVLRTDPPVSRDPTVLVDAIARLPATGAEATPVLVELLGRETQTLRKLVPPGKPGAEGLAARLQWVLRERWAVDPALYPRTALSVVRALEAVGVPGPEVEKALAAFDAVGGNVGQVAVARARRVLTARAAARR